MTLTILITISALIIILFSIIANQKDEIAKLRAEVEDLKFENSVLIDKLIEENGSEK